MTKSLALVCIPLLALAFLLQSFSQLHYAIFSVINEAMPSRFFWMTITNTGDAVFLGCALFVALHKNRRLLTNALLCALLIHYTVKFSKIIFAVLRPEHTADLAHVIRLGPPISIENYAMPSGHTASIFMAAIFIAVAYKFSGWKLGAILAYAALVGVSRIAVGAHWPADILAGAVIGILFSLAFTHGKLHLNYRVVHYISLALYVPFIYFSLSHAKYMYDFSKVLNDWIFIVAGTIALIIWLLTAKRLFSQTKALK
ncbi:MAG: phosphatase PAP2 family protein [Chitinophagaceae bacterium]|nr:MAG: phosphatase PAP2 family protein [Chitinophagaceae bacterium]